MNGSPTRGAAPHTPGCEGRGTGVNEAIAGIPSSVPKKAVATTAPSPSDPPATVIRSLIDDFVAFIILQSSKDGGAIPGNQAAALGDLIMDEVSMQQPLCTTGLNGPAHGVNDELLLGSNSVLPMHHIPLDDSVLSTLAISLEDHGVHVALNQISTVDPYISRTPFRTYSRRGKDLITTPQPVAPPFACEDQDSSTADVDEADGSPPQVLNPVCIF